VEAPGGECGNVYNGPLGVGGGGGVFWGKIRFLNGSTSLALPPGPTAEEEV